MADAIVWTWTKGDGGRLFGLEHGPDWAELDHFVSESFHEHVVAEPLVLHLLLVASGNGFVVIGELRQTSVGEDETTTAMCECFAVNVRGRSKV